MFGYWILEQRELDVKSGRGMIEQPRLGTFLLVLSSILVGLFTLVSPILK